MLQGVKSRMQEVTQMCFVSWEMEEDEIEKGGVARCSSFIPSDWAYLHFVNCGLELTAVQRGQIKRGYEQRSAGSVSKVKGHWPHSAGMWGFIHIGTHSYTVPIQSRCSLGSTLHLYGNFGLILPLCYILYQTQWLLAQDTKTQPQCLRNLGRHI